MEYVAIGLYGLAILFSLGSLVCFVMVLIQMFKRNEQTMAIVCLVLTLCTGLGPLVAFVYGWIKASEWRIKNIMLAWTGCFAISFVLAIGAAVIMIGAVGKRANTTFTTVGATLGS